MLVLSRQRDETIIIGNDIELTVIDIRGDKVRLGIRAPAHVAVHRKEVYDAILCANAEAAAMRTLPAARSTPQDHARSDPPVRAEHAPCTCHASTRTSRP